MATRRETQDRCRGCGAAARGRMFCRQCSPVGDPAWRTARARKAGDAARRAYAAVAKARAAGLTPVQAYERGYRVGYQRAYRWWHRWAQRRADQTRCADAARGGLA